MGSTEGLVQKHAAWHGPQWETSCTSLHVLAHPCTSLESTGGLRTDMHVLGEYWGFEDRHAHPWKVLGVLRTDMHVLGEYWGV